MRDEMQLTMNAISENESFARIVIAAFMAKMDPTMEEISDVKTAVSEAVTNSIVHGYDNQGGKIWLKAQIDNDWLKVQVIDQGVGISDIEQAMQPLYTSRPDQAHAGMGFSFMEAFMNELEVISENGNGTIVTMRKQIAAHICPSRKKVIF